MQSIFIRLTANRKYMQLNKMIQLSVPKKTN